MLFRSRMTQTEDKKRRAEALLRLTEISEGKLFLSELEQDFDETMKMLVQVDKDRIFAVQGRAQAYHSILKKFSDARKELGR